MKKEGGHRARLLRWNKRGLETRLEMRQGAMCRHWQVTLAPSTSVRAWSPQQPSSPCAWQTFQWHQERPWFASAVTQVRAWPGSASGSLLTLTFRHFCIRLMLAVNVIYVIWQLGRMARRRAVLKDCFFTILLSPWIVTRQCQISRKHGLYRQYCSKTFLRVSAPLWAIV